MISKPVIALFCEDIIMSPAELQIAKRCAGVNLIPLVAKYCDNYSNPNVTGVAGAVPEHLKSLPDYKVVLEQYRKSHFSHVVDFGGKAPDSSLSTVLSAMFKKDDSSYSALYVVKANERKLWENVENAKIYSKQNELSELGLKEIKGVCAIVFDRLPTSESCFFMISGDEIIVDGSIVNRKSTSLISSDKPVIGVINPDFFKEV